MSAGLDDVLFRTCRTCGVTDSPLIDGPTTPWWAELDLCSACLVAATSATVREMARRSVAARAALRAEYGEILACRDDAWNDRRAREEAARHARHRLWSRRRLTGRVYSWAYQLGVIAGYGWTVNSACNGCTAGASWRGRRPYVLGWERERWSCLLVGRHRRRVIPGTSLCTVCAPCWVCRSTDPGHDAWACEIARDAERAQVAA